MGHEAKDAQHGGTAIVAPDGTLGGLDLLIEVAPNKVSGAVAEVAHKLVAGSFNIEPGV